MLCSKNDLEIYKKYIEGIKNNIILPYDEELVIELNTHNNGKHDYFKSYLDFLCSINNKGNDIVLSRYLIMFLDKKEYKLFDGVLGNFEKEFKHSWIEGKEFVYDTTFIGKWPKEFYYEVFNPINKKEIDLSKDKEYLNFVNNNVIVNNTGKEMTYIDWYSYMKNNTLNTRALNEPLMLKKFK